MWGAIIAIIGFVVDAAVTFAEAIWAALLAAWAVVAPIVIPIWTALKTVWSDVLVPFWHIVESVFTKLREWYDRWLSPVTNFLKKVYEVERTFYQALFQPLLDTITRLKQFLELTHLAHTAFGRAIEDILNDIYRDVNGLYQGITQPLNDVIRTIEQYILQGGNLLNTTLLLGSIFNSIKGIWSIWWNSGIHVLSADGRRQLAFFGLQKRVTDIRDNFVALTRGQGGRYHPHIEHAMGTFKAVIVLEDPKDLPPIEPEL